MGPASTKSQVQMSILVILGYFGLIRSTHAIHPPIYAQTKANYTHLIRHETGITKKLLNPKRCEAFVPSKARESPGGLGWGPGKI